MYINFYTIATNYNEPLTAAQSHNLVTTHINVSQYSHVALHYIGLHQVPYETVAPPVQVRYALALYMSFYTIITNYNEPLAAAKAHVHVAAHINMSQYS